MSLGHESTSGHISQEQQSYALLLARMACIVVGVLALGLFVATLPTYFVRLHILCTTDSCSFGQLSESGVKALHTLGLSLSDYALLVFILVIISEIPCVVVAALVLWRKSDNWTALLIASLLVVLATSTSTTDSTVLRPVLGPMIAVPVANISNYLGAVAIPLIFSLFPNGRFVPRWTRWLLLVLLIIGLTFTFLPPPTNGLNFFSSLFWLMCMLILAVAQIYRYRRVSTQVERQQTKWVIFGFSLAMLLSLGPFLPEIFFPSLRQPDSPYQLLILLMGTFSLTLPIALCFGIAILRYRLYDIDVLINRTLVYGSLTAVLALVYFGSVVVLQALLSIFTGQFSSVSRSPLVLVASTLAITVLFQPLRQRIQALIDRRFYRYKYDAARTLAAFSATLRNEVDLEQLSEQLVSAIQETMQPAHVSLWIRNPEQFRVEKTRLSSLDEEERQAGTV